MKTWHYIVIAVFGALAGVLAHRAYGGVPVKFTVETSRADIQEIPCYHGETLDFEVTMKNYGENLNLPTNEPAQIFWQTNGMSAFYWRTNNVNIVSNKYFATFTPEMDPGTTTCFGFIGTPKEIYRASFVLRFKNSPGTEPKDLNWPYRDLDFERITVENAPYYTKEETAEVVDVATNRLAQIIRGEMPESTEVWKTKQDPVVIGTNAYAYVTGEVAIGKGATAKGTGTGGSVAVGWGSIAQQEAVAVGKNASADVPRSTAVGSNAKAGGNAATAFGGESSASGHYATAIGEEASASWNATSLGYKSTASGQQAVAIGNSVTAEGENATAVNGTAEAESAVAVCGGAYGKASIAVGAGARADAERSMAIGPGASLSGPTWWEDHGAWSQSSRSIAVGGYIENGTNSLALGYAACVTNNKAVVISTSADRTSSTTGSHGEETITLGVRGSDAEKIYIGDSNLVQIINANAPTPESIGAYSASDGDLLATQVATIGAYLNAEDARFVATNYNSTTKIPSAYVQVMQSNEWLTVWQEMTRWDSYTGTNFNWSTWGGFDVWSTNIEHLVDMRSPKEYAFYDGVTGEVAPDGIFQISQPRILVCAGAGYQRYVDGGCEIWLLESNGLVSDINGTTNGYFQVSDGDGEVQFEIIKGDKQTVFANANAMTRTTVDGVTHYFTTYAVTNAVEAPVCEISITGPGEGFIAETESSCPANVEWTAGDNAYTLEWWPKSTYSQMFVKASYTRGGKTRIVNHAPVQMSTIMIGGVEYSITVETVSGKLVPTLTVVN